MAAVLLGWDARLCGWNNWFNKRYFHCRDGQCQVDFVLVPVSQSCGLSLGLEMIVRCTDVSSCQKLSTFHFGLERLMSRSCLGHSCLMLETNFWPNCASKKNESIHSRVPSSFSSNNHNYVIILAIYALSNCHHHIYNQSKWVYFLTQHYNIKMIDFQR